MDKSETNNEMKNAEMNGVKLRGQLRKIRADGAVAGKDKIKKRRKLCRKTSKRQSF